MDFLSLAQQCTPPTTDYMMMASISETESGFNPLEIGVVKGDIRTPKTLKQAQQAVLKLEANKKNYSVGLTQVNKINFKTYNLSLKNMFNPCDNIKAGTHIYQTCLYKAKKKYPKQQHYQHQQKALSCYYSGNFSTGFKVDFKGQLPYVHKVWNNYIRYKRKPYLAYKTNIRSTPNQTKNQQEISDMDGQQLASYANTILNKPFNEERTETAQKTKKDESTPIALNDGLNSFLNNAPQGLFTKGKKL